MKTYLYCLAGLLLFCISCSKEAVETPENTNEPIASTLVYDIAGSETDSAINDVIAGDEVVGPDEKNWAFINPQVSKRNKLLLFFPGTNSLPSWHQMIGKQAASMGYHVVVLRYNNITPIYEICADETNVDCHRNARMEVLTGEDLHDEVSVDRNHSIENRVLRLLQYLEENYPDQGWGQYTNDAAIAWNKLVLAGHSQGGGYAGFIGKLHQVDRVVMFSASDWFKTAPANWVLEAGETPSDRIYAFVHLQDEAGFFGPNQIMLKNWEGYGITDFGEIVLVDATSAPYDNSHTLVTNAETVDYDHWFHDDNYHNGVIVDPFVPLDSEGESLYKDVWEYLLQ
ncbi:hypothetical protein FK220_011645 [Flavobacteriaceae bacterium TP-CH-4]|uniref:Alpha/beta hydrolase family protein n=1 Tax=Pelagihabitans pacificus TaxID=2696054 RepID=A0A967ATB0_9FLAO|nr:hypothetical protein [Pelagihabitans pacificus]NHF59999.1 hypothetical protein [Pelagihabitans pacificus]